MVSTRFLNHRPTCVPLLAWALALVVVAPASVAQAQISFEQPPINYLKGTPSDPIAVLQKKLDAGETELRYEEGRGYLASVLQALQVPVTSQSLVFSKTSFQLRRIAPPTPRAVYFGDDVYVGWVQGGDVMEFSAVDPQLGANFYTLSQTKSSKPKFARHTHECLQCHGSSLTRGVPGHTVRSVATAPDGQTLLGAGSFITDHTSPFQERWGGWYVSGTHGRQRHMGNLLVRAADDPMNPDLERGANVTDLQRWFDTSPYLVPHSDIVALMVLEHQSQMHNVLTQASFLARITLRDQVVLNEMMERPAEFRSESTTQRLKAAADPVVKYLLFSGETKLTDPVVGTSTFTTDFPGRGPRDKQNRSLRDFDLQTRLFRYPCSFLIYSPTFDALPSAVKDVIYRQLWDVLRGADQRPDFSHLSESDRLAILEILRATKADLPPYWKTT